MRVLIANTGLRSGGPPRGSGEGDVGPKGHNVLTGILGTTGRPFWCQEPSPCWRVSSACGGADPAAQRGQSQNGALGQRPPNLG